MSDSGPSETAKKFIKKIIIEANSEGDNPKKTDFHKIIFLAQKKLENQKNLDVLNEKVPFYWYFEGPYSTPVEVARSQLVEENEIGTTKSHGGIKLYTPENTESPDLDDTIEIALEDACKSYNYYQTYNEIQGIYENYAPSTFQTRFKFGFKESLSKLESQVQSSQSGLDKHLDIEIDRFSKIKLELIKSESSLPRSGFQEYRRVFGRFKNIAELHLEAIEDGEMSRSSVSTLKERTKDMWTLFGKFARIIYSDEYYESQKEEWENDKEMELKGVEASLDKYEETVLSNKEGLGSEDHISGEDSAWGKIVSED